MSVIAPIASSTSLFHPAVAAWFGGRFSAPTPTQARAWPAIKAGRDTLIAAPTGSGKTLSAFLAAIDGLVRRGLEGALLRGQFDGNNHRRPASRHTLWAHRRFTEA